MEMFLLAVVLVLNLCVVKVSALSPCLESCFVVDRQFESTCTNYPRQTNEICHGARTAWLNRCSIQCAAMDKTYEEITRAACQVQCNTVVVQVFVTYCEQLTEPVARSVCHEQRRAYGQVCSDQCLLLGK